MYGVLQGLGLTALIEYGAKQGYRECSQPLVGLFAHVVGNDDHVIGVFRIVLQQE